MEGLVGSVLVTRRRDVGPSEMSAGTDVIREAISSVSNARLPSAPC